LEIYGGAPLMGAALKSYGYHRIAMAFAIAGLFADRETIIEDADCIATSYPGFDDQLQRLLTPDENPPTPVINPADIFERN
jgi:3-phosphoshikimate 1-carboxyvinyltransferase